jgi:hypothetical protein
MMDLKKFGFSGTTISGATPRFLWFQKLSYVNLEQNCTLNPKIILTIVKSDPQLRMQLILKSPKNSFWPPETAPPSGRSKKNWLKFSAPKTTSGLKFSD